MKIKLFFLFVTALLTVKAQTVNIDWDGAKEHSIDFERKVNLPYFKNKGYSVQDNVPHFAYLENAAGMGKVTIQNVQYTTLNSSERAQLNLNQIPNTLKYDARIQKGGNE